jgi:hypothetical protein
LPHIGYYCDGTEFWRWWMRPARWAWTALGWLPNSQLFLAPPPHDIEVRPW